jgi:glycosyltransferase involved in cell wall biosynthesis
LRRTDVQVLCPRRIRPDVPLPVLLAAADLVVATGGELTATSAAVPALAAGVPVVAVTTDPAAELVESGRTGLVVAPRLDAVVDAIVAYLDRRPTSWRCPQGQVARPARHELARCLLPAYGEALTWSLPRGRVR